MKKPYIVRHVDDVQGVDCPCGSSRRILTAADGIDASIHVVHIKRDSELHYHRRQSEFYYVLRGQGEIVLDGEVVPIRAGHTISIPPGVRHVARGDLEILNVVVPPFDPGDEIVVTEDAESERA